MPRREHPSTVVRLVDGELLGYPLAREEDCTVWIALPDGEDEWEGLLGIRRSKNTAEIVSIPLFAYGLNLGDVVTTVQSVEGADVVSGLASDGGNFTFRALFPTESHPGQHWRRLMSDLEPYDCWFDTWSETLVAVSVDESRSQAVADYLASRESAGELRYETGR